MPHSLRAKLSGLHYKGILEDKDYKRLCHALDLEKAEQSGWEEMTVPCKYCGKDMTFKIAVCGEPKTGHWIRCVGSHKCSNCEEYTCFSHKELLKYCPNCGARMESEQDE